MLREGVPAVGGLKFSIAQKKNCKKCQLGEVPVGGSASWGSASWGKYQLGDDLFSNFVGDKNLTPFSALKGLK